MRMAIAANKRSIMTLYFSSRDLNSHAVRIVLAEKGIIAEMIPVIGDHKPRDLLEVNPQAKLPTLVDRDLVLSDANIIMEYLDERFPHPPLLPVYPVARAKSRLMIDRIQRDWYQLVRTVESGTEVSAKMARKQLQENLAALGPLFTTTPFFWGEEFSLIDCCFASLLWRLPKLGIELPPQTKTYTEKLFKRPSFKASLTEIETEMEASE
jgi:RNA polymerase-associated protein